MAAARAIAARHGGKELPNSIPKAGRAEMFSPLSMVVGPQGDRWIALNEARDNRQKRCLGFTARRCRGNNHIAFAVEYRRNR